MGMTIDNLEAFQLALTCIGDTEHAEDIRQAIDTMRKYQMMQADHKANMVDMLTEIKKTVEELDLEDSIPSYTRGAEDTRDYIADMLEERIDKLKGE